MTEKSVQKVFKQDERMDSLFRSFLVLLDLLSKAKGEGRKWLRILEAGNDKKKRDSFPKYVKPSEWGLFFMMHAILYGLKSRCLQFKVGAVLVRNRRVLSGGYNGPPRGMIHCDEIGCARSKGGRCRGAHAEMNAIVNAAEMAISVKDCDLYVTVSPCLECFKHIANLGEVRRIFFLRIYQKVDGDVEETKTVLEQAVKLGIDMYQVSVQKQKKVLSVYQILLDEKRRIIRIPV